MKRYGYARISSNDQNSSRQIIALTECGIDEKNIFLDIMSGENFERPQYKKMIKKLKKGDLIIIKSVDRLGRNYSEILEEWKKITKDKSADIQVIDMPLLNTITTQDDLTGKLISDLVLQILAYVAETERLFIRQRQAEGIAAAKARGVKFGATRKKNPKDFMQYFILWKQGKISTRNAAKELEMSHTTFYRRCMEIKNRKNEDLCCNK